MQRQNTLQHRRSFTLSVISQRVAARKTGIKLRWEALADWLRHDHLILACNTMADTWMLGGSFSGVWQHLGHMYTLQLPPQTQTCIHLPGNRLKKGAAENITHVECGSWHDFEGQILLLAT